MDDKLFSILLVISMIMMTIFVLVLGIDFIKNEIVKQQQIHNCEILIEMFSNQYTRQELLDNSTFNFSYYWGLQNDYWQCDKWFDKESIISKIEKTD